MRKGMIVAIVAVTAVFAGLIAYMFLADYKVEAKLSIYLQDANTGAYELVRETTCKVSVKNPVYDPPENRPYEVDTLISVLKQKSNTDMHFKVYYKCKTCKISFSGEGGTLVSGKEERSVRYGQTITPPVYEKEGFVLVGFKIVGDESDLPLTEIVVFEDTDFIAIWKELKTEETPADET